MNKRLITLMAAIGALACGGCSSDIELTRMEQRHAQMESRSRKTDKKRRQEYIKRANEASADQDIAAQVQAAAMLEPKFAAVCNAMAAALLQGKKVTYPKFLKTVYPKFPLMAQLAHKTGYLHYAIIIGTDGRVKYSEYIPHPSFEVDQEFVTAAERATWSFVFSPATVDGQPVEIGTILPILFDPEVVDTSRTR